MWYFFVESVGCSETTSRLRTVLPWAEIIRGNPQKTEKAQEADKPHSNHRNFLSESKNGEERAAEGQEVTNQMTARGEAALQL